MNGNRDKYRRLDDINHFLDQREKQTRSGKIDFNMKDLASKAKELANMKKDMINSGDSFGVTTCDSLLDRIRQEELAIKRIGEESFLERMRRGKIEAVPISHFSRIRQMPPEEKLNYFRDAINKPYEKLTAEERRAAQLQNRNWKDYCTMMMEHIGKEIELEKARKEREETELQKIREIYKEQENLGKKHSISEPGSFEMPRKAYSQNDIKKTEKGKVEPYGEREPEIKTIARKGYELGAKGVHKIEPEENRLPRAIAWAKRRLDEKAGGEAKDIIERIKQKRNILMKPFVELTDKKEGLENEKKRLEKERDKLLEIIKKMPSEFKGEFAGTGIEVKMDGYNKALEACLIQIQLNDNDLNKAQEEWNKSSSEIKATLGDVTKDVKILAEEIRGKVPEVLGETIKKFNIKNPYLIEEIRKALIDFADAEAAHIIDNEYKTIYKGKWGRYKKFSEGAGAFSASTTGGFAKASDLLDMLKGGFLDIIFNPVVTGGVLVIALAYIIENYGIDDIGFYVMFFVSVFVAIFMELGKEWSRKIPE